MTLETSNQNYSHRFPSGTAPGPAPISFLRECIELRLMASPGLNLEVAGTFADVFGKIDGGLRICKSLP